MIGEKRLDTFGSPPVRRGSHPGSLSTPLSTLTADLPTDLKTRLPRARDAWTGVCVSIAAAGVLAALLLWQPDDLLAFGTAIFAAATVLLTPPITVGLMVDARHQKRAGRQLRLGPSPSANG